MGVCKGSWSGLNFSFSKFDLFHPIFNEVHEEIIKFRHKVIREFSGKLGSEGNGFCSSKIIDWVL